MRYLIYVEDDGGARYQAAKVAKEEAAYLKKALRLCSPLSRADYRAGPSAIVRTAAKAGWVATRDSMVWLVEWQPGLLVFDVGRDAVSWTALRSPVPHFGGRPATKQQMNAFDEDAHNSQYRLIFAPWDAQFDEEDREHLGFADAGPKDVGRLERAHDLLNAWSEPEADGDEALRRLGTMVGDGQRVD